MAKSQKSEKTDSLNDLLAEVITVRRAANKEYEWKLKKYLVTRAKEMKHGVFDGVEIPKTKINISKSAEERLSKNVELSQKIDRNMQQYDYAKRWNDHFNDELKQTIESLQKINEIEMNIRKDGLHWHVKIKSNVNFETNSNIMDNKFV